MSTDPRADRRAELLTQFLRAQGDLAAEAQVLAEAQRYDNAHPREDSLVAELCAAVAGDPWGVAA
ncbi:hypothetical protein ACTWP5_27730 [Streptomyces sp. 4N509B]|uniref:hypothetical protein n=1 Tax=Streptomyces sp. 4N509B TaxID=3457413 RepID=UPI003FD0020A